MMPKVLAGIVAVIVVGGTFYYFNPNMFTSDTPVPQTAQPLTGNPVPTNGNTPTEEQSTITNFDECIAAGNPPLKDAPDKCLTKDGYLFIEGVVE